MLWLVRVVSTLGSLEGGLGETLVVDRSDDSLLATSLLLGDSTAVHAGMDGLICFHLVVEMRGAPGALSGALSCENPLQANLFVPLEMGSEELAVMSKILEKLAALHWLTMERSAWK